MRFLESTYGVPILFYTVGMAFLIVLDQYAMAACGLIFMAGCIRIAWAIEYKGKT
jgi:hypothetical protein